MAKFVNKIDEKKVVLEVFGELLKKPYHELNTFLGSVTIDEMQKIYSRLKYEDYCKEHGISSYEEMTEEDFIQYYEEKYID